MKRIITFLVSVCVLLSIAVPVIGGSSNPGDEILGEEPLPQQNTVPTIMFNPIVSDVSTVGFYVVGCADMAVDVSVEVDDTTPNFPNGVGNVGIFTAADGTEDNIGSGIFKVSIFGLNELITTYYWRVTITNSGDTIYYPSPTTAEGPQMIGCACGPFVNTPTAVQVQDRPTNTNQTPMLAIHQVDNTWPITTFTAGPGLAAFINSNLKNSTTGEPYEQDDATSIFRFGAYGMWDDGTGMALWYNHTTSGEYVGIPPPPWANVKTDKYDPGKTATATGPVGSGGDQVTITYDLTGYYSETEPSPLMPEPTPKPSTVPTLKKDPFVDMGFGRLFVAGCADMAVDVTVEVDDTSPNFPHGAGNIGVYTAADGVEDNFASGIFRVPIFGLNELVTYYYRVTITNGPDTIYFPGPANASGPVPISSWELPVINPSTQAKVQDRPTNTNQPVFLCTIEVETPFHRSWPLSLITDATGLAIWGDPRFRSTTTNQIMLVDGTDDYYFGAWGMWDDGSGLDFWYNNTDSGIYIGNPGLAEVKTDPENPPPPPPDEIEIFYSLDAGANWQLVGNDLALSGSYQWICPAPGTYHWIANSVGGDDDVGLPAPGTPPEAGPYDYVGIPPGTWELYNGQNFRTFTNDLTPGWDSEDLAVDIISYINYEYGESLEYYDIEIFRYNSTTGLYERCFWWSAIMDWWGVFPLQEGETYIVRITPGALSVQPRSYELPNNPIVSPVTVDIYNGLSFRGFPVTSLMDSEELAVDLINYINTNYGESLANEDVEILRYNSVTGLMERCFYWTAITSWWGQFPLKPSEGYIIQIAPGALSVQPRAYTPS